MASSSSATGSPDRLFVGNLAPSVDEYTLVQVFSKYGKISKLDLMVHNSGPQKGKPRGYAFVEYESQDDALKALAKLHNRLLRGRKLVVTSANAAPADDGLPKRRVGDVLKPTALSLLKAQRKPQGADAQIAAMEAKLAALQRRPDRSPTPERIAADELEAEIRRELEADAETAAGRGTGDGSSAAAPSPAASHSAVASRGESRTASPKLTGIAGLPAKPAFADPRRDQPPRHDSRHRDDRSPRRRDAGDRERDRQRDRSPPPRRRDESPRRRGYDSPRREDRSPRYRERDRERSPRSRHRSRGPSPRRGDRSPRPHAPSPQRSEAFQRGLASLPKKPTF